MGQRRHHHLLTHHAVEVAAGEFVTLPDEAQRLRAVQLLRAGRKVGARKWFVDRLFEADVDSAEGVGDQREAQQSDLGVVVDGDAGEVGDGFDQRLAAGLGALALGLVRRGAGLDQADPLLFLGLAVDAVDLGLAESGGGHVGVAGNGDRGGRLPVVGDAHQDDRVGVAGHLVAGLAATRVPAGSAGCRGHRCDCPCRPAGCRARRHRRRDPATARRRGRSRPRRSGPCSTPPPSRGRPTRPSRSQSHESPVAQASHQVTCVTPVTRVAKSRRARLATRGAQTRDRGGRRAGRQFPGGRGE